MRSVSRGFAVFLAVVALLCVGTLSVVGGGSAHAASAGSPYQASRGRLHYVGSVMPASLNPRAWGMSAQHTARTAPLRRPSPAGARQASPAGLHAPTAANMPVMTAGKVLQNFDGVDAIQS